MKEASFATFVSVICILLSSCTPIPVAIPLFPDEPLQEEELLFLVPRETTLAEIKEHLWEPSAIRNNGKLLLYKESRAHWFVWAGPYFDLTEHVTFLFIEMSDDDILYRYEVVREHDGCVSWGPCLDSVMYQALMCPISQCEAPLADDSIILFSQHIKYPDYEPNPEGQCRIITYLDNKSSLKTLRVQFDKSPKRAISKTVYLKNSVAPGDHTLSVHWPLSWEIDPNRPNRWERDAIRQTISCNSGESVFVSVFVSGGIIRFHKINMEIKSTTEGLKVAKERHSLID